MRDMFGNEVTVEQARALLKAKTKPTKRGYAAPPGTGPAGETCKTCRHYRSVNGGSKSFPKCDLMRAVWTHGYGTDILARAPACREWATPNVQRQEQAMSKAGKRLIGAAKEMRSMLGVVAMRDVPDDIQKTAFREAIAWLRHEKEFGKEAQSLTDAIGRAIWAEREKCAAFAYAKWDWPPRWIAASFRGENDAYYDFPEEAVAPPPPVG